LKQVAIEYEIVQKYKKSIKRRIKRGTREEAQHVQFCYSVKITAVTEATTAAVKSSFLCHWPRERPQREVFTRKTQENTGDTRENG
jgi:hypothetical protein